MKDRFISILVLAVLGLILGQRLMAADAATPSRPNVVLIISDDHAWTDYSFAGHANAMYNQVTALIYPELFWINRDCYRHGNGVGNRK
tara:strand:- start:1335 stop:1598 length:264 start_codon:yes stop_codon:yes gene_type:complete